MSADLHAQLTRWRRHLHANPELSLHETETAAFVCRTLQEMQVPFTAGVGGHGVVATLSRPGSGTVGLRADMDALPLTEVTGLPWASTRPGVMHACGHDGHTASLLGAAALLSADPAWAGTVHLVFQPAEEGYGGARAMLGDGLLHRFPMQRIFGYHNWPGLAAGTVALHDGAVMAAGNRMRLTVRGHAGHAALPHLTRDPVLAAAHLIVALQSIVSRTIDPLDTSVVSVCTMAAGSATNQIPSTATIAGTFRNHRAEVGDQIAAAIHRIAGGVGATLGVEVDVEINTGVAATVNALAEANLASAAAIDVGAEVRRDLPPSMASEDFGWYLRELPGAFAWIGNGAAADGRGLHNPGYDYNDDILPVAAGWLAATARRALAVA